MTAKRKRLEALEARQAARRSEDAPASYMLSAGPGILSRLLGFEVTPDNYPDVCRMLREARQ